MNNSYINTFGSFNYINHTSGGLFELTGATEDSASSITVDSVFLEVENILIDGEYKLYEGPIYYWNTNKICKEPINENKIQYAHDIPWVSIRRPHERYLED
jgi:hypothetical protein